MNGATWLEASKKGDRPAVLELMIDDVISMVPGGKPFGKEAFAAAFKSMKQVRLVDEAILRSFKF